MLVNQILKSKGRDGVLTLKPTDPVADALKIMADQRIGTIVVSVDGKQATGILSERDIVRELGSRGDACLSETVGDLMTKDPVTCTGQETAEWVLQTMTDGRFRHLPVMEGEEMVGLISIGDVVQRY